jgi:arabinogalactan endo-1,4-beta-galactosidase
MTGGTWNQIGCSHKTEFDCVSQDFGNDANLATNGDGGDRLGFSWHWANWINPDTVQSVFDVGLNTIRIPIGYWSYSALVDKNSEHFPDGDVMLPYLDAVVQRASDLGMFVIIDLHGAPGAQQLDPFTGQVSHSLIRKSCHYLTTPKEPCT